MKRALALLAGAVILVTACGSGDTSLERADRALAELDRGEVDMSFTAGSGQEGGESAGPVGFSVAGRFDMDVDTQYPVLDVTYTRVLGDQGQVVQLASDGNRIVLTTDGTTVDVPPEQAQRLRLAKGDRPAGLGRLGVAGWLTEATESEGPVVDGVATTKITGPVDAADLLSDLAGLAAQVSGQDATTALDGATAERVRSKVRSGDVELLVDENDLPRRVRATVNFGTTVAPEVERALGPYAAPRLEMLVEIRAPGQPVAPPSLP